MDYEMYKVNEIFAQMVADLVDSAEYKVFSGCMELVERGCRLPAIKRVAKTIFRFLKAREKKAMKGLSPRAKIELHKKIRTRFRPYRKAFALLH